MNLEHLEQSLNWLVNHQLVMVSITGTVSCYVKGMLQRHPFSHQRYGIFNRDGSSESFVEFTVNDVVSINFHSDVVSILVSSQYK